MTIDGKAAQFQREHNERAWLGWHIAALSRAKKLPDLRKLQARAPATPRQQQTPDQQWAVYQAMAQAQRAVRH